MRLVSVFFLSVLLLLGLGCPCAAADFSGAVVIAPQGISPAEIRAVALFRDEVTRRSGLVWPLAQAVAPRQGAAIIAATSDRLPELLGNATVPLPRTAALKPEGFRVVATEVCGSPAVIVEGADARGLLFGLGRLLRAFEFSPKSAALDTPLDISASPAYPLRGIQLGFRAMSNTYGNWRRAEFERQIGDLAVFGCNAIELVAGFDRESPQSLTMPSDEAMAMVSGLADAFGLDVWVWTPAREKNYADPAAVERTLSKWEALFRRLPRIDGIYVPGGDPGDTPPELLLPLVERQAALLRNYHPQAKVWMSVQSFSRERLDYFFNYLASRQPAWLAGVIYAPWNDLSVAQLRSRVPSRYGLRLCPDIGHVLHCQYPAEDMDIAFAITQGREPICPRPEAMAGIARAELPGTQGGIAYSDGVNDDVNKILWLQLCWDPSIAPEQVLRDYGRYFVGGATGEGLARGLALLEKNWRGSLLGNPQVGRTFDLFTQLEEKASAGEMTNWRFLCGLYRAYYDRYTQLRLRFENNLEREALGVLLRAPELGAEQAMAQAEAALDRAVRAPTAAKERKRLFELGDALHRTIGMKLSVPLHKAAATARGANLDSIDWPLNNRLWLKAQFAELRKLGDEAAKLRRLERLARWSEPGRAGFYDNVGHPGCDGRTFGKAAYAADPAHHASAFDSKNWIRREDFTTHRIEWMDHLGTLGETPLELVYESLDPRTEYELTLVYGETKLAAAVRLVANGRYELHPMQKPSGPPEPRTFAIPAEATRGGRLVLRWERDLSKPSIRGMCHVSEIWLRPRR